MEERVKIPTKDGKHIYGVLNTGEKRNKKLIVFVHGITGNKHEHQYFLAPRYFIPHGYDTFRFNFYSGREDARKLHECSISIHVEDLNLVLAQLSHKEIYLVAHSLGCLVALRSDRTNVKKTILWDPTKGIESLEQKNISYDGKTYVWHKSMNIEVGAEMIREWSEAAKIVPYVSLATEKDAFLFAGNNTNHEAWMPHLQNHEVVMIEGTTHCFVEEGKLEEVYAATLQLLEN